MLIEKIQYGNRAHNIPCLDLTTGRVHITSQNHGYAVDAQTLPSDFKEVRIYVVTIPLQISVSLTLCNSTL